MRRISISCVIFLLVSLLLDFLCFIVLDGLVTEKIPIQLSTCTTTQTSNEKPVEKTTGAAFSSKDKIQPHTLSQINLTKTSENNEVNTLIIANYLFRIRFTMIINIRTLDWFAKMFELELKTTRKNNCVRFNSFKLNHLVKAINTNCVLPYLQEVIV